MLSAFSVTSDLASCTRCTGMRTVSPGEFRRRVEGRPFGFLLRYHLRHHDEERLRQGLEGSLAVLPPSARELALEIGERWREETAGGGLASADCAALLDRVREAARTSREVTAPLGGDQLMDVFEVATLSVVLAAREDDELREAVGDTAPGFLSRYGWNMAAAALLGWLATVVEDPVGVAVVWAGLGLALLPPVARLVAQSGAGAALALALALAAPVGPAGAQQPDTLPRDPQPPAADTVPVTVRGITVRATGPATRAGGASAVELNVDSVPVPPSPTLSEVLVRMPLVRVRQNSRGQVQPSIRGVEERQISVQLDGIPITLGWDNRTDLSVVPMLAARRATLVRGLSSVVDGPNVLGAVVKVDVADTPVPETAPRPFRARGSVDHTGALSASAEVTRLWRPGDGRLLLRVGGGGRTTPGEVLASGVRQPGAEEDLLLNSDRDYGNGFVAAKWRSGSGEWLSLSSLAFVTERGVTPELHLIGSDTAEPRFWRIPAHRRFTTVLAAGTGPGETPLGDGELEARVGLDLQHLEIDAFDSFAYRDSVAGETGNDRTFTVRLGGEHTLLAGTLRGSLTLADTWHEQILPEGRSTFEQRLLSAGLETEQPLAPGATAGFFTEPTVTLGGSVDGSDTPETGGFAAQPAIWGWGARGAAGVGLFGGAARLHGGYSRKVRFPALRELYSGALGKFVPNPNLGPEVLKLAEAGVTARPGGHELQLTAFHQQLEGSIVRAVVEGGRFRRENRGETRSAGVEAVANVSLGAYRLRGDLTLQDVTLAGAGEGERAEYQPEVVAGLRAEGPLVLGVRGRAEAEYVGPQFGADPRLGRFRELDSSLYLEAGLSRPLPGGGTGGLPPVTLELAAANITDETIFDQLGLPRPGRTWSLRLRVF